MFIRKKDSVPSTSISNAITATEIGRRRASRTRPIMIEIPLRTPRTLLDSEAGTKKFERRALSHGAKRRKPQCGGLRNHLLVPFFDLVGVKRSLTGSCD